MTPDGIVCVVRCAYDNGPVSFRSLFAVLNTEWFIEAIFLDVGNNSLKTHSLLWNGRIEKLCTHDDEAVRTKVGFSRDCRERSSRNIHFSSFQNVARIVLLIFTI